MTIVDLSGFFFYQIKVQLDQNCNIFVLILKTILTQFKVIRTDRGMEFDMPIFFYAEGIIHQTNCVCTPQYNDVVKRKH